MANENDIFQGDIIEAGEDTISFLDENDEVFNLLGMSEEEKEKASQALREEDKQYNDAAGSEESSLDNMLSQAEQAGEQGVPEQTEEVDLQDMLGMMESDSLEDMLEQVDLQDMPEQTEQMDFEDMLSQAEQGDSVNMPEQDDLKEDERVDSLNSTDVAPDTLESTEDENLEEAVRALIQDMDDGTDALASGDDELANLDSLHISDEVMEGIDFNEDLTNASEDDMLEATAPSGEETNWLKKKEEKVQKKEEKKEEKRKAKEAKKKAKQMAKEETENAMEDTAGAALDDINLDQILSEGEAQPSGTETKTAPAEKLSFGQKLSLTLFGPEEDEELSAEEIARLEEKQAAKEKKKEEKAQKKAEAQQEKAQKKAQAREMAVVKKAAAQDKKEQIRQQEEEEDAKEKKFTSKQVSLVAVILALLACTVVLGTNQFNYHMMIARATNYFEMQKYRKAYEQIVGVDVKDRDQLIRDKIYCVMYVQQQIDSYQNFCKLEMYDSGLDSLVKGFRKYNKHYAEAKELGIEADLDRLRATIENELSNQYGLSIPVIEEWLTLDQTTYTQTVRDYVASMQFEQ